MIGSLVRRTMSQRRGLWIVALVVAAGIANCSRKDSGPNTGGPNTTGSVGFDLTLSSVAEVVSVKYTITGNGITPITRTVDVTNSMTARAVVTGMPAGNGYLVELSAASSDKLTTCAGSATFNIVDGQTAQANIVLQCKGPGAGSSGGVTIGGTFDNCPVVKSLVVAPQSAPFGGIVRLDVMGSDPDGDPLTYSWSQSPSVGAFMNGIAASTTFTCTMMAGGPTTLTLAVTDGTCTSKVAVQIACCAGSTATCGVGAGGASGSTGSGTGGSGAGTGGAGTGGRGAAGQAGGTGGTIGSGGSVGGGGTVGAGGRLGTGGSVGAGGNAGTAGSVGVGGNSVGTGGIVGAGGAGGAGGSVGGISGGGGGGAAAAGGSSGGSCTMPPSQCVGQACVDCTAATCSPETDGCTTIADAAERQLCEKLYACAVAPTHPGTSVPGACTAFGDPTTCWCGTNPTTCSTVATGPMAANGPCLQEVFAAAHTMDPAMILAQLSAANSALGRAFNLVSCRGAFCTDSGQCPVP